MAPLCNDNMNELNLDSLELEPSPMLRNSTSMFNMRDKSIHPIDEYSEFKDEDSSHTEESTSDSSFQFSSQPANEEHKQPTIKRTSSFLKYVDADPNMVHKHCSTLKPKKSAMKSAMKNSKSTSFITELTDRSCNSEELNEKRSRSLTFSTIEVRTYNVAIGDNPGSTGSKGTPVSLCWEYDIGNIQLHDLGVYEELRPKRRNMTQLYLSPYVREWMLLRNNGYTAIELKQAAKLADKARKERSKTVAVNNFAPISVQQKLRGLRKKSKRILKA